MTVYFLLIEYLLRLIGNFLRSCQRTLFCQYLVQTISLPIKYLVVVTLHLTRKTFFTVLNKNLAKRVSSRHLFKMLFFCRLTNQKTANLLGT